MEIPDRAWDTISAILLRHRAMADSPKRAISLYLVLTVLLSGPIWAMIIRSGHMKTAAYGFAVPLLMWCPGTAAVLTCLLVGRSLRTLGWSRPRVEYLGAAYCLPIVYAGIVYGAVWLTQPGAFHSTFAAAGMNMQNHVLRATAIYVGGTGTVGVIFSTFYGLGEEIGWRGFLVPEMAKQMSFARLSVVSGVIWGLWHTPELLFADYNAGTNPAYAFACFLVMIVGASFLFAWLRLKSGSLWPAALLHGSHNAFVQGFFDQFTRDTGHTRWITTEFGAGMILTIGAFAAYFWTRRNEVEKESRRAAGSTG
jgi:membrane protease YdiL (CAAX protease family)